MVRADGNGSDCLPLAYESALSHHRANLAGPEKIVLCSYLCLLYIPVPQEVLHIHDAIRGNLASFAAEARSLEVALSPGGALGASQLGSLVERHRFLRAVCSCHTASESYVLLPAARALCQGTATNMQVEP